MKEKQLWDKGVESEGWRKATDLDWVVRKALS